MREGMRHSERRAVTNEIMKNYAVETKQRDAQRREKEKGNMERRVTVDMQRIDPEKSLLFAIKHNHQQLYRTLSALSILLPCPSSLAQQPIRMRR